MILMACSFFMPLPLVTYNPRQYMDISMRVKNHSMNSGGQQMMPFQLQEQETEPNIEFFPCVYDELFYCFEKHMAVLAFKVSANPNKSPQGCTTLTNSVFNRTFQTHSKSMVNYGSIEIQFDYNFEHPMFVPVADAHGLVEEDILEQVFPMFNIFLIHSFIGPEHQDVAQRQISKIHKVQKNPLIFMIIHDESRKDNVFTQLKGNIVEISIGRFNDLLDIPKANLRNTISQHFLRYIGDYKIYEADIPARLKSLQQFSDFANLFQQQQRQPRQMGDFQRHFGGSQEEMQLVEALDITRNFLNMIDQNKDQLRSEKVLTMNFLFEEACCLEKLMKRETLNVEVCEKYRLRIQELFQKMKNAVPSKLTQELKKIIEHQNYIGLTSIISKFIRSFLNFNLQPLLKEREDLRSSVQNADIIEEVKEEKYKKIGQITKTLEKRWYSNEFLYREYYISELSQLRDSEIRHAQPFTDYLALASMQISQGQPFEIIDGNNLQFIRDVYQKIQADRMQEEQILVVSVVGPQSSGKSLLLNTLFGAQFLSSAGRCTRGIYGCLIDIKCDIRQTHFKKILILDSEGIQSTEAVDEAFDKRIVFYILCVSHVVLICNKGEMNKHMEDTIKLATDCIMQVREQIDSQPQVNIIMNNVQINENSLYQTIESLSNSILEMRRHEKLRQIFTIDQSNVFLLPNAFAQSGNEEFVAYQPSYQFAQKVDQLRKRILSYMQCSVKGEIASYTLESWFRYAQSFWDFTDNYVGLTDYSTLEERKEDIVLLEFIKKLIADNFEDPNKIKMHEKMIQEGVDRVLQQHQGFDQTNINVIKTKIDNELYPTIQQVEFKIQDEFRKFIDEKGIRPQIKRRRVQQLDTQIRQHFFNWQQLIQKYLGDFNQKKSKFIGEKSLQNAIDAYIQANHSKITVEEAGLLFETEWFKIETDLKKQLKSSDQVSEEQFSDIGQLYRANIRSLIIIEQERALIANYQNLDRNVLLKQLRSQNAFFFFNSQTIKQSTEIFIQQISREKNFLSNRIQFFEEVNVQEFYNWKKLIQERFIFQELEAVLIENASKFSGEWTYIFRSNKREGLTTKKVNAIINEIREECEYFRVNITEQFESSLTNIEKTEIEKLLNEQKKRKRDTLSQDEEINCIERAIKNYVDNLKNKIEQYFKYSCEINRNTNLAHLTYFDSQNIRDLKNSNILKKDIFSYQKYTESWNPQNLRLNRTKSTCLDGLETVTEMQSYLTIQPEISQKDPYLTLYLENLVRSEKGHLAIGSKPVEKALTFFFSYIDHEKLLQTIQNIVLENIFRNPKENKHQTVEELVRELIVSDDPNITQKFCAMDFNIIQRIVVSVEKIVVKINEDMEPYCFTVSENGSYCLHQIAQTYIIRIMQEVIRLTEHAPLFTQKKTKDIQRDLFIAKLTSNDKEMDIKLAVRAGRDLIQIIINHAKQEQIQAFKDKIEGEQNLFKLRTIIKNIENQALQIADGKLPNPFQYYTQAADKGGQILNELKKQNAKKKKNDNEKIKEKEEEKKEEFKDEILKLKKINTNLEFSPEEIIMYYTQPSEFLIKRFNDQWKKVTDVEIERAQECFDNKIKQINLNFQKYFQYFQAQIKAKNIQLATNVFIPEGKDQISSQNIAQQAFKSYCQKAMAIYFGLVITKEWKAGTAISIDNNVKMIVPESQSLVTHNDIRLELLQPFASILQQSIQNELISNIFNFIQSLMSEMNVGLDIDKKGTNQISLQENELIGNLQQVMKTRTLGCDQICPLCRRQCDQIHDGDVLADRIHKCEEGHQIQGFGGNKNKSDNQAITYGCHEMMEQDRVTWKGRNLKWRKFQQLIYDDERWNLEEKDQGAKQLNKEKNIKIWNLIGPYICQFYRLEQNIDISFIQADIESKRIPYVQNTFYVLMLDNSGSMSQQDSNGQSKWINLTSAVSQFIINIEKDMILKNNSKVSIITYNTNAKLEIEAQEPSENIVAALKLPKGGTDFNPPLLMAKDLIDKYHNNFDNFVLVMMSDGDATHYPKNGVENIKKSPAKSKIKFKSIAYGDGTESLNRMAEELGGTSEKILLPNQLSTAFIQMIPNLYTQ